jgi:hypothetical protein
MRAAEQLPENCAISTLRALDLEAAFSSSLFTGRSFTTSRARLMPPPLRAFVGSSNSYTRDRSRPHPELSAPDDRKRRIAPSDASRLRGVLLHDPDLSLR